MRFAICLVGIVALPATLIAPRMGLAEEAGQAVISAIALQTLPEGAAVHVRSLDNSADSLALKREFETALRAAGFALSADPSGLVLTFTASDRIGGWSYRSGALVKAERGHDPVAGKELDRYIVNLFNTRQGGLINEQKRPARVTPSRYRLSAAVEDRRNGKTLWTGWAVANLVQGEGSVLYRKMVPVLAASVGHTVREKSVELR